MLEDITNYATIIIAFTLLGIYMQLDQAGKMIKTINAFLREKVDD
tara:strand:- start:4 stop:138 length:135 start_codon:yes stop_codon:yes gene_type:complete